MLMPERPSLELLADEQREIQVNKPHHRTLADYNEYLFTEYRGYASKEGSATAFLGDRCAGNERSIDALLRGLSAGKDHPAHWADMGGAYGFAMRCFSSRTDIAPRPLTTSVDVRDLELPQAEEPHIDFAERHYPGFANPIHSPNMLHADVHTVKLENPADLITAIEVVQYLDDPLRAMVNWYNQLADRGVMSVATDHMWGRRIVYKNTHDDRPIMGDFFDVLRHAGIEFGFGDRGSDQFGRKIERIRTIAIEKKPNTELVMNTRSIGLYVTAVYEAPLTENEPVIVSR